MSTRRTSLRTLWLIITATLLLAVALLVATGAAGARWDEDNAPGAPRTVTYTYDDAGRLVSADYGEGQGIGYSYDAAGNMLQRVAYGFPTPTRPSLQVYLPTLISAN